MWIGPGHERPYATAMEHLPMTIVVPTYQRRDPLLRLLRSLDAQLRDDADLAADLDIHVIIDGSTDGSAQAVRDASWTVPVVVHEHVNAGRAAARNRGLAAVRDRIVWFLDDDLVAPPGLVERHRRAHLADSGRVVVGLCEIPGAADASPGVRAWWDEHHAQLREAPRIDRFDLFTVANASASSELLRSVGGFDERFTGYGLEDYELAVRLLAAGVAIDVDVDAVAWHPDVPPVEELVDRHRDLGANTARLALLHPALVDDLFPPVPSSLPRRIVRASGLRRPGSLMRLAALAALVQRIAGPRLPTTAARSEKLARAAARAAGVASVDPSGDLLARELGQAGGG